MDVTQHGMRHKEIVDPDAPNSPKSSLELGGQGFLWQEEGCPRGLDHDWRQDPFVHRNPQHPEGIESLILESHSHVQDEET